ncbi:hypothetical protein CWC22_011945 [Pseudoalteromonas rubra]|uniref:Uncharacterized protein n=1 Tax=Pseudoalteromonas rubra TaxID=43658 RepID=A0A5S3URR8_9GAMM|nr:hypothetical protein CWC22_011945 [Pseudoalteromonas rubra]
MAEKQLHRAIRTYKRLGGFGYEAPQRYDNRQTFLGYLPAQSKQKQYSKISQLVSLLAID